LGVSLSSHSWITRLYHCILKFRRGKNREKFWCILLVLYVYFHNELIVLLIIKLFCLVSNDICLIRFFSLHLYFDWKTECLMPKNLCYLKIQNPTVGKNKVSARNPLKEKNKGFRNWLQDSISFKNITHKRWKNSEHFFQYEKLCSKISNINYKQKLFWTNCLKFQRSSF